MLTSLFSLSYVTSEFHRFLHRGRAQKLAFVRVARKNLKSARLLVLPKFLQLPACSDFR